MMLFNEIIEQCAGMPVMEKRVSSPDYVEWVIYKEDLEQWDRALSNIFGPAVKSNKEKAAPGDFALTEKFGGVEDDQTLYRKVFDDGIVITMLWPWQNNLNITIKFALIKS